jgi:hypothetical protein
MISEMELRLVSESIRDINDALSRVDQIKEGLGLRGQSPIEVDLEAAKSRLKRILLNDTGQL